MTALQIPIALPVDPAMGEDDFLITPSNKDACLMADVFGRASPGVLLLLGPQGSGKSHLARIWQKKNAARLIDFSHFDPQQNVPTTLVWEDADDTSWDKAAQEKAFHLLNLVKENRAALLITATQKPSSWNLSLADLRSRLNAVQVAALGLPDDALMAGLILKHVRDRQLRVSEDVLSYLITRLPRDGAAVAEALRQLDEASLSTKRAITVPFVREALQVNTNESEGS